MLKHLTFPTLVIALAATIPVPQSSHAQAPAAPVTEPSEVDPEILVIGQKAKKVRIKFRIDDRTRAVRCKAVRSSGDKEFDRAMCEPVRRCARVEPFNNDTVRQCIDRERQNVFREWAAAHRRS
jgi:hypothetical protein